MTRPKTSWQQVGGAAGAAHDCWPRILPRARRGKHCNAWQDKAECQARMGSRATVGGSVEGGGLLRELTTTTIRTVP